MLGRVFSAGTLAAGWDLLAAVCSAGCTVDAFLASPTIEDRFMELERRTPAAAVLLRL